MSRIESNKISLASSIVVDLSSLEQENNQDEDDLSQEVGQRVNLAEREVLNKAKVVLSEANAKAQRLIEEAQESAAKLKEEAQKILDDAKNNAQEILKNAQNESSELLKNSQEEAEQIKQTAMQEGAKEGYEAGYSDGQMHIKEELLHKVNTMDDIVGNAFEMKNKIMISARNEIIELVLLIARKMCMDSIDKDSIIRVVDESIKLLSDKENIELTLSENYAKLFSEVLDSGDLEGVDIDKLKNIKLHYNANLHDDTLIIQTLKERLDLGFETRLNHISRKFHEELHSIHDEKIEDESVE